MTFLSICRRLILFAIFSLITIGSFASADLNLQLESIRAKYGVPALTAGVVKDGKIEKLAAVGSRILERSIPVTKSDKWHLGSNTKAMTATLTAILIASQDYGLSWDRTMESLFPEMPIHKDFKKVTLRDLFAHTSGATDDLTTFDEGKLWKKLWGVKLRPQDGRYVTAHSLLTSPPSFERGKQMYSNAGYIIAGAALEKVTGESWEVLISQELFRPLKMHSCGFGMPASLAKDTVDQPWGHKTTEKGFDSVPPGLGADNPASLGPAGIVHCSLRDWARFAKIHLMALDGKDTPVLKAKEFTELHKALPGKAYTMGGWGFSSEAGVYTHSGSNTMSYSFILLAPKDKKAYLIATNMGDSTKMQAIIPEVIELLKQPDEASP